MNQTGKVRISTVLHHAVNERVSEGARNRRRHVVAQFEDGFHHGQLGRGRIEAGERDPVVNAEPGADELGPSVDGSRDDRHLNEGGELSLRLWRSLCCDKRAVGGESCVGSDLNEEGVKSYLGMSRELRSITAESCL